MNPLVFLQFYRLALKNWEPFFLIVVPAVVLVSVFVPGAVAAAVFALAFVAVVVLLVGGFARNLRRGWTGKD